MISESCTPPVVVSGVAYELSKVCHSLVFPPDCIPRGDFPLAFVVLRLWFICKREGIGGRFAFTGICNWRRGLIRDFSPFSGLRNFGLLLWLLGCREGAMGLPQAK